MKKTFLLTTLVLSLKLFSQSVSGYWYGVANVSTSGSTNNYMVELILHQNKSQVKGIINYYFKQTFRSIKINGIYNAATRKLTIADIPLTFHASPTGIEVDCLMDMMAILKVAKAGSDLSGVFIGKPDYRYTCADVNFNLKWNADISKEDSILHAIRLYKEAYQVWKPTVEDTLVAVNIIPRKVENPVIEKQFSERENIVSNEITVESDSLKVDFYDNGEVDGDSISIFYNRQLIAFNRMISEKAVHFDVVLDSTKEINEISMFADNLGRIPPNTALMIIRDNKRRYEIRMTSNFEKNATVRIKRKKDSFKLKQ